MIVVRLRSWLLRLFAPLAAAVRMRSPLPVASRAPAGESPLVAASAAARPYRAGLASGTWLEDARRLRVRPATRIGSAAPSREHIHQILHDPHWAAAYNASQAEHLPRTAPAVEPRETERHVRRGEPISRPLASSAQPDDHESPTTASLRERRRLVYVRELVRRGIYNEGFTPGTLPDQYRPHRGRDTGDTPPVED